jgi:RNA polymerase sigma-70 factor (sigma-E family)
VTSDEQYVEFVRARASALLRTACLLTAGDRHAAEDLVQTALMQAFVKRRRIREPNATEAYVRKILVRTATRRLGDRWRKVDLVEESPEQAVSGTSGIVTDRLTILSSLRALPVRQRAVVVLRYYDDLSEAQIAAVLGCSRGAVKSHSSRALKTLRKLLAPQFAPSQDASKPKE